MKKNRKLEIITYIICVLIFILFLLYGLTYKQNLYRQYKEMIKYDNNDIIIYLNEIKITRGLIISFTVLVIPSVANLIRNAIISSVKKCVISDITLACGLLMFLFIFLNKDSFIEHISEMICTIIIISLISFIGSFTLFTPEEEKEIINNKLEHKRKLNELEKNNY